MTDHDLMTLLHDAAEVVRVPAPPADAILGRGRRARRRRRAVGLTGVAAVALVAAAGVYTVLPHRTGTVALDPAAAPASTDWAVAQGGTIHLGTGAVAHLPGQVKAMYYTSAGTLVRVGATPYTDAPDSNYWLATPDGKVSDFDLALGDRVPGTDPTLPYLAYAKAGSDADHWTVVLRDVRTGEVVTSIPITGAFTWGGWVAPPVALSGDHVYVGVDGTLLDVRWRTGEVRKTTIPTHLPQVRGANDVDSDNEVVVVRDVSTGKIVYRTKPGSGGLGRLSPDGTHLLRVPEAMCDEADACSYEGRPSTILDLVTGSTVKTSLGYGAFGWSATGRLLIVADHTVKSCDPDTLVCASTKVTLDGTGPIRVSGNDNES